MGRGPLTVRWEGAMNRAMIVGPQILSFLIWMPSFASLVVPAGTGAQEGPAHGVTSPFHHHQRRVPQAVGTTPIIPVVWLWTRQLGLAKMD